MKKFLAVLSLCALLLLSGCSPSPIAVTVGDRQVDASEYAFYLHVNRKVTGEESGTVLYDEKDNRLAREAALEQILSNEVMRIKCEEFGLELSKAQKESLATAKDNLVDSLGGMAAYLEYLNQSMLTDRAYDKFQENSCYTDLLYDYMTRDSQNFYTDEALRQYFNQNYATVKYIFFSFTDEDGNELDEDARKGIVQTAQALIRAARVEGDDFDALMAQYNEDPSMTTGFPISKLEAASTEHLTTLFSLEENEVGDLVILSDGCYILKRCPVTASYYDENQRDIFLAACNDRFDEALNQWKAEYEVKLTKTGEKINLSNLSEYIK